MKQLKHVFTVLLLLCTTVASAHDFEIDGIYYKGTNIANTVEVTYKGEFSGNKDYAGNVNVPDHIVCDNGVTYQVVGIGDYAFMGCTDLVGITIPNSVTSIGEGAFDSCTGLANLILPNNVTNIGGYAFNGCAGITSVIIPYGITSIEEGLFSGCTGIKTIVIPSSVTSIGAKAFNGCEKLAIVTIPDGVTNIGDKAFEGCSKLGTVVNLSSLNVTKGSTEFGYIAYYADEIIKTPFVFEESERGVWLIKYCGNETHVVLPNKYKDKGYSILQYAFTGCNVKSITVGTNVEEISERAFDGCDDIAKVFWLPNTPPEGYENLNGKINYVSNSKYGGLAGEVVVTQFLSSKFEVDGLVFIPISFANRQCCIVDDVNNNLSNIVVKDSVLYRNVTLSITDIMPYSFYGNATLETLTLNNNGNIGKCAFYGNKMLANVVLNNNGDIGEAAFYGNNILTDITFNNNGAVGNSAFEGCRSLKDIVIPASVTSVGDNAFKDCGKLKNVIIGNRETVLSLGKKLFDNSQLDSLYIGARIRYLSEPSKESSPFCENKSLRTVVITDVESNIYDYEFYNCSGLKTVTVGDGVESIGCWAFSGCYNLSEFVFGSSVSSIAEEAFSDCIKMTKITSRALMPPVCGEQALDDIDKWVCVLYAPERNNELYQEAEQWKEFLFKEKLVTTDKYATYVIDGEEYKTLLLTPGKRIVVPSVANKDGQEFKGWEIEDPIMSDNDIVINGSFKSDEN